MKQDHTYTIIDGQRVKVPELINEIKYGRQYTRLDAPYGYRSTKMTHDGHMEECVVYTMPGVVEYQEQYACMTTPKSDPLVAYRCFRVR